MAAGTVGRGWACRDGTSELLPRQEISDGSNVCG